VNPWDACNFLTREFGAKDMAAQETKRGILPGMAPRMVAVNS
ncbi:MAG: S-adenosylmethionine decarboxylase proenzyme, partial [Firmicutes bacterium]|nr:S-adenosylmethionine decarboxylase proenzyme [Bacillota bacterium]